MGKPKWTFYDFMNGNRVFDLKASELLEFALTANPTPPQSGFYVYVAGMTRSGKMIKGSNHEYSKTRALHGEETMIAHFLELEDPVKDPLVYIAFKSNAQGSLATPCGNCRDVLRQYSSPDKVTVACGAPDGGRGLVMSLSMFYFEDFYRLARAESLGLYPALETLEISWDVYSDPLRSYGAAIVTEGGVFTGSDMLTIGYHPILPLQSAINRWYFARQKGKLAVKEICVAAYCRPDIPYLERQIVAEMHYILQKIVGRKRPIPVKIIEADQNRNVLRGWLTDSVEWLPHPFMFDLAEKDRLSRKISLLRKFS